MHYQGIVNHGYRQTNRRKPTERSKGCRPKNRRRQIQIRLNALRLGLYSHTFIIKTEDEQVFQNFSADFLDEFKPQTPSELELLEQSTSSSKECCPGAP